MNLTLLQLCSIKYHLTLLANVLLKKVKSIVQHILSNESEILHCNTLNFFRNFLLFFFALFNNSIIKIRRFLTQFQDRVNVGFFAFYLRLSFHLPNESRQTQP